MFDAFRDAEAARRAAESLLEVSRGHGLGLYLALGTLLSAWARARLGDRVTGMMELRQTLAAYADQGNKLWVPFFQGRLAEFESEGQDAAGASARIDAAFALAQQTGEHWTDAFLRRIRGDILLKVVPENPARAEEAYLAAIAVAREQGARSFGLQAALKLAKLYQSTGRPVEAHDALAPALEGFSPTPEMPEIAEAQALLAALAETSEVKTAAASRQRRLQLQASYSQAVMWSRGFGSEEAKAAFARAQELATAVDNAAERFDAYYGLFIGSLLRGELRSARETAETLLREAEKEARTTEAAAAHRNVGLAGLYQGDLAVARAHFEQALRIFDPERDREAKFRFGTDVGAGAPGYLALTNWLVGEVGPAWKLIEEAIARALESRHAPTLANVYWLKALFDAFRDDAEAARRAAESVLEVSRGHGLGLYLALGALASGWARARLGDRVTGRTELQQALAAYADQGNKLLAPFFQGRLAEFEAEGQDAACALARIDEALALAQQTGEHWTDALLHRIRGDILLKADSEHSARAEEAYLAAIAIAREQGARSFGLQAALRLAQLHQSIGRPVEAHDVLTPSLELFSPTPEMPETAEAQALLAALAETDEVKAADAQRKRRLYLQTQYRSALAWSRGAAAEETKAAAARAEQLIAEVNDPAARFEVYDLQFLPSLLGGRLASAGSIAETYLGEARNAGARLDMARAGMMLGEVRLYQGAFTDARRHLVEALDVYDPGADIEIDFASDHDWGTFGTTLLALVSWQLGEVERTRAMIQQAKRRANELQDIFTLAIMYSFTPMLEAFRGDADATLREAETLADISARIGVPLFAAVAKTNRGWARAQLGDREAGLEELRQGLAEYAEQKALIDGPFGRGLLAELEAEGPSADKALAQIDEALALAQRTGEHWTDALLHRIRGDILLKADPQNPARAEEAYRAAIAFAREQNARSFGLQAALKLSKLYQSTGRPVEAHDALAPALEGFSPTPEMPKIAEAQALLAEARGAGRGQGRRGAARAAIEASNRLGERLAARSRHARRGNARGV